jgi:drug/metabolite transporter (DMT)-like permease
MLATGLLAPGVGTLCWNEVSQRLPTNLVGQLIAFETLAALTCALLLRGEVPSPLTLLGMASLIVRVGWSLRAVSTTAPTPAG